MKRLGWIVAVLALAVLVYRPATGQDNHEERISSLETRVAVLEGQGDGRTLYGVVTFNGTPSINMSGPGSPCFGVGDYADLAPGSTVTVLGDTGPALTATLGPGPSAPYLNPDGTLALYSPCAMPFEVAGLVEGRGYRITFGDGRWVHVTSADLLRQSYVVNVSVP